MPQFVDRVEKRHVCSTAITNTPEVWRVVAVYVHVCARAPLCLCLCVYPSVFVRVRVCVSVCRSVCLYCVCVGGWFIKRGRGKGGRFTEWGRGKGAFAVWGRREEGG